MDLGCPSLRGLSVRRHRKPAATLPLLLERTFPGSISFSAFGAAGGGAGRSWWQEIYSPGFIVRVKCVVVCCRKRRLPVVKGADVHRRRRYRRQIIRLRWLRALIVVIVIICMVYHHHCCQEVKGIGRQVQVVQAHRNDWELLSESVWHCGLIWVVMDGHYLRFVGCH